MTQDSEIPFDGLRPTGGHRARRVTPEEPYQPVSFQLHPKVLNWAKAEARQRGIEYQTVINEVLLKQVG
jgi:uncharacterized protein (DUF4415 family)